MLDPHAAIFLVRSTPTLSKLWPTIPRLKNGSSDWPQSSRRSRGIQSQFISTKVIHKRVQCIVFRQESDNGVLKIERFKEANLPGMSFFEKGDFTSTFC